MLRIVSIRGNIPSDVLSRLEISMPLNTDLLAVQTLMRLGFRN